MPCTEISEIDEYLNSNFHVGVIVVVEARLVVFLAGARRAARPGESSIYGRLDIQKLRPR